MAKKSKPNGKVSERIRAVTETGLIVIEITTVSVLAVGVCCLFVYEIGWVIFAGADRQLRLNDTLKLLSDNWKAGVLLLVPLFYRTIRAFLERVEEVAGMKARQPQEQESRPNPEQI